jgi:Tfp pilus assembly pilus retraction ATPase PilT
MRGTSHTRSVINIKIVIIKSFPIKPTGEIEISLAASSTIIVVEKLIKNKPNPKGIPLMKRFKFDFCLSVL